MKPRPLLIIAPNLLKCHEASLAHGLNPKSMENIRCVIRAESLRGLRPSTPFIASDRQGWGDSPESWRLNEMVDLCLRTGTLRIAQDDDIAAAKSSSSRSENMEAAE